MQHSNLSFKRVRCLGLSMSNEALIDKLNEALGWELRAISQYAHYAAYIRGIHRFQLSPHFASEATESMAHADVVRASIVKLGGIAVTDRNPKPIEHTTDYRIMLEHSLDTETTASKVYAEALELVEASGESDLYDAIEQIYLAEVRSVEELRLLVE